MKFFDLLRMSSGNLWKRKVRTVLTVLGVVIGVASIVVMVSLGLGLSQSLMAEYESYGSLRQIQVNEGWGEGSDQPKRLSQALIDEIRAMEHVESVHPVLETQVIAKYGSLEANLQLQGLPKEAFSDMNIKVAQGSLPLDKENLTFFYGNEVPRQFYNPKGGGTYWDTGEMPDIDLMRDPIFMVFDVDAYYAAGSTDEEGNTKKPPKKYLIEASGLEETPGENQWSQYGWLVLCDLEKLQAELKKMFKNKVIPGQPQTKGGKPYKEIFYTRLLVNADDVDNVMTLQKTLTDMGYSASSQTEWVESQQKTMGYTQAVLGGIGAVSLFVAAIGIANTMMMSIYERTKEIGVMKVLGCDLRNIRSLFLLEAGFIGLIGGVIGLALSLILSLVINKFAVGLVSAIGPGVSGRISYIPVWLAFLSLIFAVLVGMAAGFFPARRAMRLSPLAAIRNE